MSRRSILDASLARANHRALQNQLDCLQAPRLAHHTGLKGAITEWCCMEASRLRKAAWTALGLAFLEESWEQSLCDFVESKLGGHAADTVRTWVIWHRQKGVISRGELEGKLRDSKLRGVWDSVAGKKRSLRRTRAVALRDGLAQGGSRSIASLGPASREVGRWPLHAKGVLPAVRWARGHIGAVEWLIKSEGMGGRSCLIHDFFAERKRYLRRGVAPIPNLDALSGHLRAMGGAKLLALHQLMAMLKGSRAQYGRRALRELQGCTLTASRSCVILLLERRRSGQVVAWRLTAQGWASLLGVPSCASHPLRRGLRAVAETAGKALIGQAMHFEVATALLSRVWTSCGGSQSAEVSYASLFSGVDVMAAAMDAVFGKWRFLFAVEASPTVRLALKAAWMHKHLVILEDAFDAFTADYLRGHRGQVDVLATCLRCAPWSSANTVPLHLRARRQSILRALEEIQALLLIIGSLSPRVVLVESVCGIMRRQFARQWSCVQGWFLQLHNWWWSFQILCPRDLLGGEWPRRRLWIVGVPK